MSKYKDDGTGWEVCTNQLIDRAKPEGYIDYMKEVLKVDYILNTVKSTDKKDIKILDCGCNFGYINLCFPEQDYTGIDGNAYAISKAKENFSNRKFENLYIQDMIFKEEFDLVLCMSVMQHVYYEDKLIIIQKIKEALKPQGCFLLMDTIMDRETATQLTKMKWVLLLEKNGFEYIDSWFKNDRNLDDINFFRRL